MARQRLTEDFVKHYRLMCEQCGSCDRDKVHAALERDPRIAGSIKELQRIWQIIEQHRRTSKRRFIVQAHPKFAQALEDYRANWLSAYSYTVDWEDERAGREPLSMWLDKLIAESESESEPVNSFDDEEWEFDPDLHSAASFVEGVFDYIADKSEDGPFFVRSAGAFQWLTATVGLNLKNLEERWREFPVIAVQEHISNAHGLDDPYSLFGYLENVRLAYMIGADLAAVAMCRAVTEVLIRRHYDKDDKSDGGLIPLIKRIQEQEPYQFLRRVNVIAKVSEANEVLHFNRDEIRNSERARALVRDWTIALQEMITRAPRS